MMRQGARAQKMEYGNAKEELRYLKDLQTSSQHEQQRWLLLKLSATLTEAVQDHTTDEVVEVQ